MREGVLERYDVELIAASREAIDMAEDRERFRVAMAEIGLETPRARFAHSRGRSMGCARGSRVSNHRSAVVHHGWERRRYRLQP